MNICFFTEMDFSGKIPRDHVNMRTEFAWMAVLNAEHRSLFNASIENWDLGIIIIPKKRVDLLISSDYISQIKKQCKKVAVMQEGPQWLWQDLPIQQQIWYLNVLSDMDFLLVHNESDIKYFKGLTHKPCYNLPSLMITDQLTMHNIKKQNSVIIGGNMCSWYSGLDSYIVALQFGISIDIPSMGRRKENEERLDNLNHLPYMNWKDWMVNLSQYKYAVHLMRTHAAGTMALNCAYWGIPCIGYKGLDTQEKLHTETAVELGDLESAKKIVAFLKDPEFYESCSNFSRSSYNELYTEASFIKHVNSIFKNEDLL